MTANYINAAVDKGIDAPIRRRLDVREITEALMAHYYQLGAGTADWREEQRDEAIRVWTRSLDTMTGTLRRGAVNDLENRLCIELQRALETSRARTNIVEPSGADFRYGIDLEGLEG